LQPRVVVALQVAPLNIEITLGPPSLVIVATYSVSVWGFTAIAPGFSSGTCNVDARAHLA
jgi:hypothetical protein